MIKTSRLTRLVRKYGPLVVLLIRFAIDVIELVNKAVNYAGTVSEFRIFLLERKEQTRLCS